MKAATGLAILLCSCRNFAAFSSAEPPISPIMTIPGRRQAMGTAHVRGEHLTFCCGVLKEDIQTVYEIGAVERITSNTYASNSDVISAVAMDTITLTHTERLSQTHSTGLEYSLVGEGARTGHDPCTCTIP
jgi:hypothetical protein